MSAEEQDDEFISDIKAFIEASGMKELARSSIVQSIENARAVNYTLPPAYWDIFLEEIDMDEYMDHLVPFFSKHYTRDEIKQLTEFYNSDVGKRFQEASALMGQEAAVILQRWGDELSGRASEKLKELEPEEAGGGGTEDSKGEGDCECPMCGCLIWSDAPSCKKCGADFEED